MRALATSSETPVAVLTVSRGLQVLRAFRSERSWLSNAELVRRTGLSKATVSRLTSTLLQLGFLVQVAGSRHFELAPGALGIGQAFVDSSPLLPKVDALMQGLADQLGASAALAVPNDLDMLYIAYRASARVGTLRLGVGSVLPMGKSATGRAYLWALPVGEQRKVIARLKRQAGPDAATLEQSIHDSFLDLHETGTCCVSNGVLRDTFGIALPVHAGRQRVLMAMSCGKAAVRPDLAAERKRIGPALKAAAARLEDLLADADGQP